MSAVEVRPASLPQDAARLVKSWWPLYEGDAMWVPPLIMERKDFFNPAKNPYFKVADVQMFMAFRGSEIVGTIAATVDSLMQKHDPGIGMFGFFEFQNDPEIAKALFDAACEWLRGKGMERVRGPFNFSPNHEFGLLVDGFDTPPAVANPHNPKYYQEIYEAIGLEKVMDWYAYWLVNDGPVDPRFVKITDRMLSRTKGLTIEAAKMENWDRDALEFWDLYNDAWEQNWGHVPFSKEEFMHMSKGFKMIADPRLNFQVRMNGELVGASITLPDVNQAVIKMNGSLFPFGWWYFLRRKAYIDTIRVFVLGVKKEYQKLPIGALMYVKTWEAGVEMGVRGAEASLILENNVRMRGAIEKLGGKIYKTYRSYEVAL